MAKEFVVTFDDVKHSIGWLSFHTPAVYGEDNHDLMAEQSNVLLSKADYLRDVFKAALADEPSETDLRKAEMWINDRNPLGTSYALRNSMNGIFKEMLPEDGSVAVDSVEGARMLADRISVDNSRYPVRGEKITQQNYRYVLNHIALLSELAMTGEEYSENFTMTIDNVEQPRKEMPCVGFLDRNNQPITLVADENIVEKTYNPRLPAEFQFGGPYIKPNIFKRIANLLFGKYEDEINEYNNNVARCKETLEIRKQQYTAEYGRKVANLGRSNAAATLLAQAVKEERQTNAADRVPTSAAQLARELAAETGALSNTASKTTAPAARNVKQNEKSEITHTRK